MLFGFYFIIVTWGYDRTLKNQNIFAYVPLYMKIFGYSSTAIGFKVKYFTRDSDGANILGSTNINRIVFDVYNFSIRSLKDSISLIVYLMYCLLKCFDN